MTFEAFTSKLSKIEKRFGKLRNHAVVMHFRIGTHGGNIPENTHPFPISDSYSDLRELEWVSSQGMAHNGIISACSRHHDIKQEKVSDTMVFLKRVVAPIAKYSSVTRNQSILDALGFVADSKLCFMDGKDNIVTYGSFERDNGVLYSNASYIESKFKISSYWDYPSYSSLGIYGSKYYDDIRLFGEDLEALKDEIAGDYGLFYPFPAAFKTVYGEEFSGSALDSFACDPVTNDIYIWSDSDYDWSFYFSGDEYEIMEEVEDAEDIS